ncbi:MAG: T9SS type A sorting domain-containing protein [Saprospiraceae bacterium]|uniref:Aminopeptidase N n=1 Tax=Candidatus Opimibacter skivensis TaxID=2982028 RepID=A0A9D7STG1_9BACT|nr:T9SS type A sorting domain-containing protein [Candidatus Opimibacter skivensis]
MFYTLTGFSQPGSRNIAAAETDVTYQEMHVEIDPAINRVDGEITYFFSSRIDHLSRFVLDYADGLSVNYIKRGNSDLTYTHADNLITIDLGKDLHMDEKDTILISFSSVNALKQEMHAGVPVISTDLDLATLWYPGKKDLIDKIDSVDLYITTPLGQRVASNGVLVNVTEGNARLFHHWKHRYPIATTYLLNLAITNYTEVKDSVLLSDGTTMPILYYLYPESVASLTPVVSVTPDVLQFFESRFGPYPFSKEKFGYAQYTFGGALEVQTMPFMGFFNLDVIAHEMAHQWFGDMVTFGSWSDIWLSEGMAEYLSGLATEALKPTDWNGVKLSKINSITSMPGGSVFVKDTNDLSVIFDSRLTYNKGFYLAHMLRWIVGDSLFFEGCRQYLNDPKLRHGFARTADFQHHMEEVSGKDLNEFFSDWLYGEGFPSYTLTWNQVQDSVIVWVDQTQSDPSVSFFEMPIQVQAFRFGIVADTVFNNTYNHQRFSMYVRNINVSQLIFDPNKWILSNFNKIIKGTVAVGDVPNEDPIVIYPNPASQFIEIANASSIDEVEIAGITGIYKQQEVKDGKVDIRELLPGYYIIRLRDRDHDKVSIRSLIIQH